jgi:hypothetical protein
VALSEVGTNPSIFWYQGQAWWKLTVNGRLYYVSPTRIYSTQDGTFVERDPLDELAGSYYFPEPSEDVDPTGLVPYDDCVKLLEPHLNKMRKEIETQYIEDKEMCREGFLKAWGRYDPLNWGLRAAGVPSGVVGLAGHPASKRVLGISQGREVSNLAKYYGLVAKRKGARTLAKNLFTLGRYAAGQAPRGGIVRLLTRGGIERVLAKKVAGKLVPGIGWALLAWDLSTAAYVLLVPHYDEKCMEDVEKKRKMSLAALPDPKVVCACFENIPSLEPGTMKWPAGDLGREPFDWGRWPDWVRQDFVAKGITGHRAGQFTTAPEKWAELVQKMDAIRKAYGQERK